MPPSRHSSQEVHDPQDAAESHFAFAKGGGETSGGGNGYVTELRDFPRPHNPIFPDGTHYVPFGMDPNSKRQKLSLFDLSENASSISYLYSVFPYKALYWKDPAATDPRLLNVCRSLEFPTEGPHCWSLINKIAQIRLAEPDFAEFLLQGMGDFEWIPTTENPPSIDDQGDYDTKHYQARLVQIARRDAHRIRVSRHALHDGYEDIDPLAYADFVGLILHEVIYAKISPIYETSMMVRLIVPALFTLRCPAVGLTKSLLHGADVIWLCGIGDFHKNANRGYRNISLVWKIVSDMHQGKNSDLEKFRPRPKIRQVKNREAIMKDLIRFAAIQSALLSYFRNDETTDPLYLNAIAHPLPDRTMSYEYYHTEGVNWLAMVNVMTENFLGGTTYMPRGYDNTSLSKLSDGFVKSTVWRDDIDFNKRR